MEKSLIEELKLMRSRFIQSYVDMALVGHGYIFFDGPDPVFSKKFTAAERSTFIDVKRSHAEAEWRRLYPNVEAKASRKWIPVRRATV